MLATTSGLGFAAVALTFAIIAYNFVNLKGHDEGTALMVERAAAIRSGSKTFLRQEYKVIAVVIALLAVGSSAIQERCAGLCLLMGSLLVLIAEEIGMRAGTYANVRTANAARVTKAISRTLRIATLGGSVGGFSVAFGLFGFLVLTAICWAGGPERMGAGFALPSIETNVMSARLTAYSLGFSIVAMFNRVAGGTYTKSADIGNDMVSKGEFNLEEDDPRNVCSIADLIGDCINDLAGNLSDLSESYVATLMSCTVIAIQNFSYNRNILELALAFPILLATGGLVSSVVSIMFIILKNKKHYKWISFDEAVQAKRDGTVTTEMLKALEDNVTRETKDGVELRMEYSLIVDDPGAELTRATFISAGITVAIGLIGAHAIFGGVEIEAFKYGWISPMLAAMLGIATSVIVGILTSIYTDTEHKFVRHIAEMAREGPSFVISEGMAVGNHSAFWPMLLIAISLFFAFDFAGFYGVAIAAVGVLSFVAETVSIDAFGPIADNAGGIAEGCGLAPEDRAITDKLDALGNTTAAIGKGNAISSASYSTITMFMAFIGCIPLLDLNSPDTFVRMICGTLFGVAVIKEFISLLTKNTLAAAWKLADEAVRQLKIPEVFEGKVKPDYNTAIRIASDNALHYMLVPSLLSVVSPLIAGFLMGPAAQLGLLMGATGVAIGEAFFNGNAGGAYDNAKKMIEMGLIEGLEKHTPAHLAAIIGDMIGDIMKDVVAVCCDICIKIMAVVSTATALTFFLHHIL
ncbi:sodium/proton-translocating pyrophosphatase [Candidatus Saccharibacteria bacterium]|nr:sodium/proton-translocating pyrophosphatase [Candidatus Saccharibacteria bacterium]